MTNSIYPHTGSALFSMYEFWGLLDAHGYLRVTTDLGACCRAWPKELFNLLVFPRFEEALEIFCRTRGAGCLNFHVYQGMFFALAWVSAVEMAQSCSISSEAGLHIHGSIPLNWGLY